MAVPKLQYAIGNAASTTLSVAAANSDTSVTLTSDTNFAAKSGEGMVMIDEAQATEELAYSTGKSGAVLTIPLANRGLEGGSAQGHAINATVKGILTVGMWNDLIDTMLDLFNQSTGVLDTTKVVTPTGTQTLTNKTLTSPVLTTPQINDTSLDHQYVFAGSELTADRTVTLPLLTSGDTFVFQAHTQTLTNKTITPVALINTVVSYTPDAAGTSTLDLATGNIHKITMPAGNITIAVSNEAVGQCFLVELTQDAVGSRTVTWFSTIKWAGGSAPTLTTTASKRDTFGFRVTGTDTYDGFIVGQNI